LIRAFRLVLKVNDKFLVLIFVDILLIDVIELYFQRVKSK
jgi:hypothetical protein